MRAVARVRPIFCSVISRKATVAPTMMQARTAETSLAMRDRIEDESTTTRRACRAFVRSICRSICREDDVRGQALRAKPLHDGGGTRFVRVFSLELDLHVLVERRDHLGIFERGLVHHE